MDQLQRAAQAVLECWNDTRPEMRPGAMKQAIEGLRTALREERAYIEPPPAERVCTRCGTEASDECVGGLTHDWVDNSKEDPEEFESSGEFESQGEDDKEDPMAEEASKI